MGVVHNIFNFSQGMYLIYPTIIFTFVTEQSFTIKGDGKNAAVAFWGFHGLIGHTENVCWLTGLD